jgi:hypothetical protein
MSLGHYKHNIWKSYLARLPSTQFARACSPLTICLPIRGPHPILSSIMGAYLLSTNILNIVCNIDFRFIVGSGYTYVQLHPSMLASSKKFHFLNLFPKSKIAQQTTLNTVFSVTCYLESRARDIIVFF